MNSFKINVIGEFIPGKSSVINETVCTALPRVISSKADDLAGAIRASREEMLEELRLLQRAICLIKARALLYALLLNDRRAQSEISDGLAQPTSRQTLGRVAVVSVLLDAAASQPASKVAGAAYADHACTRLLKTVKEISRSALSSLRAGFQADVALRHGSRRAGSLSSSLARNLRPLQI